MCDKPLCNYQDCDTSATVFEQTMCSLYSLITELYIVSVYMDSENRAIVYSDKFDLHVFDKFDLHVFGKLTILNLNQFNCYDLYSVN